MNIRLNTLMILFIFPCMMNAVITDEIARNSRFKEKHQQESVQYTQAEKALANSFVYQQRKKAQQEVFSFELESKQVISRPRALIYYAQGKLPRESLHSGDFSLRAFKKNCKNSIIGYKESYNQSYLNCNTPECSFAREMIKELEAQKEQAIEKEKMAETALENSNVWQNFIKASKQIDQAYYNDKELYGKI